MRYSPKLILEALEDRCVPALLAALAPDNHLLLFDSATPGQVSDVPIIGLLPDEKVTSIDLQANTGQLVAYVHRPFHYDGVSDTAVVDAFVSINLTTGQITRLNYTPLDYWLNSHPANTLLEVNPASGRIHLFYDMPTGQAIYRYKRNHDVSPPTSTVNVAAGITNESFPLGQLVPHYPGGSAVSYVDLAFAANGGLYLLDEATDGLAFVPSTTGLYTQATAVGPLGVAFQKPGGFDIAPDGTAYAALTGPDGVIRLATIDLATGAATIHGTIGTQQSILGLAAVPEPATVNHTPFILGPIEIQTVVHQHPFVYSAGAGTALTIVDPDAPADQIFQVDLFGNGTGQGVFNLSTTTGIQFIAGDGTDDEFMSFTGTLADLNAALEGLTFTHSDSYHPRNTFFNRIRVQETNPAGPVPLYAMFTTQVFITPEDSGPPTALDDSFTIPGNVSSTLAVLANDSTADLGEVLTITSVTQGQHGTVGINSSHRRLSYVPALNFVGQDTFTYTITDGSGNFSTATVTVTILPPDSRSLVVGSDAGQVGTVTLFDAQTGATFNSFTPYGMGYVGGVRVVMADVDGDGRSDVITSAAKGLGGQIRVFTRDGIPLPAPWTVKTPFTSNFAGRVEIAAADFNGDQRADIAVTGQVGRSTTLRVFDGATGTLLKGQVIPLFTGSVRLTTGDVNGDYRPDVLLTGTDFTGALRTYLVNPAAGWTTTQYRTLATRSELQALARVHGALTGHYISTADLDLDGRDDLVVSTTFRKGTSVVDAFFSAGGPRRRLGLTPSAPGLPASEQRTTLVRTGEQLKLVTSPFYGVKLTASQTGKSFQRTYALGADYLLELLSETPGSGYVATGT